MSRAPPSVANVNPAYWRSRDAARALYEEFKNDPNAPFDVTFGEELVSGVTQIVEALTNGLVSFLKDYPVVSYTFIATPSRTFWPRDGEALQSDCLFQKNVCLSGFSGNRLNMARAEYLLRSLGATIRQSFCRRECDILITNNTLTPKTAAALKHNTDALSLASYTTQSARRGIWDGSVKIVTKKWLLDTYFAGTVQEYTEYRPRPLMGTHALIGDLPFADREAAHTLVKDLGGAVASGVGNVDLVVGKPPTGTQVRESQIVSIERLRAAKVQGYIILSATPGRISSRVPSNRARAVCVVKGLKRGTRAAAVLSAHGMVPVGGLEELTRLHNKFPWTQRKPHMEFTLAPSGGAESKPLLEMFLKYLADMKGIPPTSFFKHPLFTRATFKKCFDGFSVRVPPLHHAFAWLVRNSVAVLGGAPAAWGATDDPTQAVVVMPTPEEFEQFGLDPVEGGASLNAISFSLAQIERLLRGEDISAVLDGASGCRTPAAPISPVACATSPLPPSDLLISTQVLATPPKPPAPEKPPRADEDMVPPSPYWFDQAETLTQFPDGVGWID